MPTYKKTKVNVSPLIRGGIYKRKNTRTSRKTAAIKTEETLADLKQLTRLIHENTNAFVDAKFPKIDFLANEPGSHISHETKLSNILTAIHDNLLPMRLPSRITEHYQKTLRHSLERMRQNFASQETLKSLSNFIKVYPSISSVLELVKNIEQELSERRAQKQTAKTIERYLSKHNDALVETIPTLTNRVNKCISENKNDSIDTMALKGAAYSLERAVSKIPGSKTPTAKNNAFNMFDTKPVPVDPETPAAAAA